MMEHLVNAGMNFEDAAMKAPQESIARFEKNFGQQLYKKKYPPKGHVYFRGVTHSFIVIYALIAFNRHANSHKWLQWTAEEDSSYSLRWYNPTAVSYSAEKQYVTVHWIWNHEVVAPCLMIWS